MKAEEAGFVEVSDAVVIVAATLDSLSFVEQSENNNEGENFFFRFLDNFDVSYSQCSRHSLQVPTMCQTTAVVLL